LRAGALRPAVQKEPASKKIGTPRRASGLFRTAAGW